MGALRRGIVAQFRKPRGVLGRLAGRIMASRPSNRRRNEWTIGLLDPKPGERVLEIGCGPGVALALCAARPGAGETVGLDHSEAMVAQATERLRRQAPAGDWRVEHGTTARLAEWPARFDAVCSVNVMQFMEDLDAEFAAIRDALRPGGRVVTTYMPRNAKPTRQDALAQAARIERAMRKTGFDRIRSEILELEPVPAVAVIGTRPAGGQSGSTDMSSMA